MMHENSDAEGGGDGGWGGGGKVASKFPRQPLKEL